MYELNKNIVIRTTLLYLIFICVWSRSNAQKNCGDCKLITKCSAALQLLKNNGESNKNTLLNAHCGYQNNLPMVCCSELSVQRNQDLESHPNINLLADKCGFINGERIIGGTKAGLYEFPWMVLISYQSRYGLQFKCGGTLINDRYVLTAAHCIANLKIAGVRVGENDINTDTDCEGETPRIVCESRIQDIQVEKAIPHEQYKDKPLVQNDIGLLKLKRSVDFTAKNAGAICLPVTAEQQNRNIENQNATVAGWGYTEKGYASSTLLRVEVPTYTRAACKNLYNRGNKPDENDTTKNKLCAGEVGKDSCGGDSGGPLMLRGKRHGADRYIQYGIVSYGPRLCASDYPGVYTEITPYMKWILDNINN